LHSKITSLPLFGLFLCLGIFTFCTSTASAQKNYSSFYPAPETNQYFIKPLTFKNTGVEFVFDVTIRDSASTLKAGDLRYTVVGKADYRVVDSILVVADGKRFACTIGKFLFAEREGSSKAFRHESKISAEGLKALLLAKNRKFIVVAQGKANTYTPSKSANKKLNQLAKDLPFMF